MNANEAHPKREFGKPDQSSPRKALVIAAKCGVTGVSSCGPGNIPPAMTRRRGNPNWGRPARPVPAVATAFEVQVRRLGLTRQTCAGSRELRGWCERNKNRCYIPEWLLEEWEIAVDPYFSGAA